jgi:predicted phage terminase large subunit-like protein
VRFPAYWLAHRPDDPVILTSYGASLATGFSRRARDVVESDDFREIFPEIETDKRSRAADEWTLKGHRGGIVAAGVGGPITGHGAMLGIIDDPFENWKQAYSATVRDNVWAWWRGTFRTRVWEGGAIVLIMTRWHEDDLAGRLLQTQGDKWTVLRLPAMAETQQERDQSSKQLGLPEGRDDPLGREAGEALAPGRFSEAALEELERDVGTMAWFAEYQGVPTNPEGNMFKRQWFQIVGAAPASPEKIVRYWDKAGTEGDGARTAGVRISRKDNIYYVEDVVKGQFSSMSREKVIRQTAVIDGQQVTVWTEQEPGSGGKESAEATIQNLAGFDAHAETVTGSKEVRARPFAAQCEAGNVKLVRGDWNGEYIEELVGFPSGTFADQVDASSGAFNKIAVPLEDEGGFAF